MLFTFCYYPNRRVITSVELYSWINRKFIPFLTSSTHCLLEPGSKHNSNFMPGFRLRYFWNFCFCSIDEKKIVANEKSCITDSYNDKLFCLYVDSWCNATFSDRGMHWNSMFLFCVVLCCVPFSYATFGIDGNLI